MKGVKHNSKSFSPIIRPINVSMLSPSICVSEK